MDRRASSLIALAALVAGVLASWYFVSKTDGPDVAAVAPAAAAAPTAAQPAAMTPVVASAPMSPASTEDQVAQWIADSMGGDAAKRATAIAALAGAPRATALPVLRRILTNGEPQVDRPLALRSLRDLALNQGDADGAIRDTVRQSLYHGDDLTNTDDAQEVLDIIEESELK